MLLEGHIKIPVVVVWVQMAVGDILTAVEGVAVAAKGPIRMATTSTMTSLEATILGTIITGEEVVGFTVGAITTMLIELDML